MKVLQINTLVNSGSTGRIAENIGKMLVDQGHLSYIAYGRASKMSDSQLIKVGNSYDHILHGMKTRLFDKHGFGSKNSTEKFIGEIKSIQPDLVHLHNIHGYYINIEVLFDYLKRLRVPVVWTLHDCWSFTGHCSFFEIANCHKWIDGCYSCPNKREYPASWIIDNSRNNYIKKKALFTGIENITMVSPSQWLANHVKKSFLNEYKTRVISNGIDLDQFKPIDGSIARQKYNLGTKRILLGVANIWNRRKGLLDFLKLRELLNSNIEIVLVGLDKAQIGDLPIGITGIQRTESLNDLVALYSAADLFINPTYSDNFPTTNLESLACGTPVITYDTGGSPEAIDENTGVVVNLGDISGLLRGINETLTKQNKEYEYLCRTRAELLYNNDHRNNEYLSLYAELLGSNKK